MIDASVVANALGDDGINGAVARSILHEEDDIAAPDLMDPETVSVLRKRWMAGTLSSDRFRAAVEDLGQLPVVRHPALPFQVRTYQLRANITPYDALYVALAEAFECPLVTADRRLATAPGPRCEIRLIQT